MRTGTKNIIGQAKVGDFVKAFEYSPDVYTKLLMHFEGENGSIAYIDAAGSKTITRNGNPALSSAAKKFGGTSGFFNGSADFLTLPDSDDWYFGAGDFTIDFWVNLNSTSGKIVFFEQISDSNNYFQMYKTNNILEMDFKFGGVLKGSYWTSALSWSTNTWYHIAFVRTGSSARIFVNGVSQTLTEYVAFGANDVGNISSVLYIGSDSGSAAFLSGYMDEARISKNAQFTSNFTPAIGPYKFHDPNDPLTKLLLHCDGITGDSTIYDNSPTPKAVANNGVTYDNSTYVFGVSSTKFVAASSQYLSLADSTDWAYGTGDFTVDFWVKFNSLPTSGFLMTLWSQWVSTSNRIRFYLYNNSGQMQFVFENYISGVADPTGACNATVVAGTWYHVALTKSASNHRVYLNGVQIGSTVVSATAWGDMAAPLEIGRQNYATTYAYLDGWIDEVRFSKGICKWFTNFTLRIYAYESNLTTIPIVGLDGDTDEEYRLISFILNGTSGAAVNSMRLNGDTGATNYGRQLMEGIDSTVYASRDATDSFFLGYSSALGNVTLVDTTIYAKSGLVRTGITKMLDRTVGTTAGAIWEIGQSWNNATDNITSISIDTISYPNGIGFGSYILLLKKISPVTSGTRYGNTSLYAEKFLDAGFNTVFEHTRAALPSTTKLLIHGNAVVDATGKTVTNSGVTVDTSQYKFPNIGKSLRFVSASSQYLSLADSADWDFETADFTIDFWVRLDNITNEQYFFNNYTNGANRVDFGFSPSLGIFFYEIVSNVAQITMTQGSAAGWAANTWYHVALIRSGTALAAFRDGIQIASVVTSYPWQNFSGPFEIGRFGASTASSYLSGWLQEFRITNGTALWTSTFSSSLPVWTDYGGATTELIMTNLEGNNDALYRLEMMTVNNVDNCSHLLQPNGDTNASNYGRQRLRCQNTSVAASRQLGNAGFYLLGYGNGLTGATSMFDILIYARVGTLRTAICQAAGGISGTTVDNNFISGEVWTNTTDKISSMNLLCEANALGVGTYIRLSALKHSA